MYHTGSTVGFLWPTFIGGREDPAVSEHLLLYNIDVMLSIQWLDG